MSATEFQKLASATAKAEDGKSKVKIGDMRETLSKLASLEAEHIFNKLPMDERPLRILKKLSNEKLLEMRKKVKAK